MRVVVALGGNALLRRGQPMSVANQRENVRIACDRLAPIAAHHELVVSHGNGPQIGLLALEEAAYEETPDAPLDVLGAETQGMIGYLIEQELGNRLPFEKPLATLLTMIEVDPDDPAFGDPTKPDRPDLFDRRGRRSSPPSRAGCSNATATACGGSCRRRRRSGSSSTGRSGGCSTQGCVVICAGGGGIPTCYADGRQLRGVEAVIDKDHASGLLARDIGADMLIMATDAPAVFVSFGKPDQRAITQRPSRRARRDCTASSPPARCCRR